MACSSVRWGRPVDSAPGRLLLVRTGGLGDIVMALPGLRAIRRHLPDAHISVVASSGGAWLVEREGLFNEVVVFGRSPERPGGAFSRTRIQELAWLARLRSRRFDTVAALQPVLGRAGALRLRAIVRASGCAQSFGRDTDGRGGFYTNAWAETLDSDLHEVERVLAVAGLMGASGEADISITPDARDEAGMDRFLAGAGLANLRPLVALNPGSLRPSHRWPLDRFAAVAGEIARRKGGAAVVVGSPADEPLALPLVGLIASPAASAAGLTSIGQAAALLKKASILITNDTGAMHLAAAVGTPVVAIFGQSDPRRVGPHAPPDKARALANHVCGLPNGFGCRDPRCLLNVSVDQVVEAALELLK